MRNTTLFLQAIIIIYSINVHASAVYEVDSAFLPATLNSSSHFSPCGLIANGGPISIKLTKRFTPDTSSFYLMNPNKKDSSITLFDNATNVYNDDSILKFGPYKKGTPIVLKSLIGNKNGYLKGYNTMKMYSGLERRGLDRYVSDHFSALFGWVAAGRSDFETVEICWYSPYHQRFKRAVMEISNVFIEGLEKFKVPDIHFDKSSNLFKDSLKITMNIPDSGFIFTYSMLKTSPQKDTINPLKYGAKLKMYYTTDGSDPDTLSKLYNGPITLKSTTTLKAFAVLEGDTNWFPSEIVTEKYTKEGDVSIRWVNESRKYHNSKTNKEIMYFGIDGRKIKNFNYIPKRGIYIKKDLKNITRKILIN